MFLTLASVQGSPIVLLEARKTCPPHSFVFLFDWLLRRSNLFQHRVHAIAIVRPFTTGGLIYNILQRVFLSGLGLSCLFLFEVKIWLFVLICLPKVLEIAVYIKFHGLSGREGGCECWWLDYRLGLFWVAGCRDVFKNRIKSDLIAAKCAYFVNDISHFKKLLFELLHNFPVIDNVFHAFDQLLILKLKSFAEMADDLILLLDLLLKAGSFGSILLFILPSLFLEGAHYLFEVGLECRKGTLLWLEQFEWLFHLQIL